MNFEKGAKVQAVDELGRWEEARVCEVTDDGKHLVRFIGYADGVNNSTVSLVPTKSEKSLIHLATSVKAGNRKSGGIIHCVFLVKLCQLEVRGFDIKTDF